MAKKSIIVSVRIDVKEANKIADAAKGFESKISLQKELMKANAKSIMGIIMLTADKNDELEIVADGVDSDAAVKTLENLISG
ncbi:phosphocarrier protein HPr [Candidatus Poribacteria bacterium]|jgi:phosphotransferase system HPr (HPr) family protein|nr:phosphocarrier protein HPr [Candidatus Poribacteria bacterium]MEC7866356.1 HPr family phosphocarrier protein [Candidatus Poribacteria bacterium]MEE3194503.1 HPr family phosphocarrier protein [Candidatus Poribacteria bacterium]|tara:strand:+ start:240 stop:485 length:246 start_codon:yes stop_codon:yes gene_type:complete